MIKTPQLTMKEKKMILDKKNKGYSVGLIAKEMGRSRGTINYLVNKVKQTGSIERADGLSSIEKKKVIKVVLKKPSIPSVRIKDKLALKSPRSTISNHLNKRRFVCKGTNKPIRVRS